MGQGHVGDNFAEGGHDEEDDAADYAVVEQHACRAGLDEGRSAGRWVFVVSLTARTWSRTI